jgi:Spy/CpxP family protein refolding chaperone
MNAKWLSLVFVVPALLSAQGRGPRPWWDSSVIKDLNLNDAQTSQIHATVDEYRGRMSGLRAALNTAEATLEAAFNEDPVDQRKANDAIEQLGTARGELTKAVSQMDLKLRTILTSPQWQELQKRQRFRLDRPRLRQLPGPTGSAPAPNLKQQP